MKNSVVDFKLTSSLKDETKNSGAKIQGNLYAKFFHLSLTYFNPVHEFGLHTTNPMDEDVYRYKDFK